MDRDKTYSLISVDAGDEREIVIQAGALGAEDAPKPAGSSAVGSAAPAAAPNTPAPPAPDAADAEEPPSTPGSAYRTTTEEELGSIEPMSQTQKAVILCAVLFIVGFAAYYFFLR